MPLQVGRERNFQCPRNSIRGGRVGEHLVVCSENRVDMANVAGERDPVAIGRDDGCRESIGFGKGVESGRRLARRFNIRLYLLCLPIRKGKAI